LVTREAEKKKEGSTGEKREETREGDKERGMVSGEKQNMFLACGGGGVSFLGILVHHLQVIGYCQK